MTITAIYLTVQVMTVNAAAQDQDRCRFIRAPTIEVAPTFTPRELEFEIVLSADIPTKLPRLGFTLEVHWTPLSSTDVNPFTGQTAAELGAAAIRDNHVELESEINLALIQEERTGGWLAMHFDIVDNFSPAQRSTDRSVYTHKLNFELDTSVSAFNWLPERKWLRNIDVEGSLDYLASRWSFSVAFVIPIAPW